MANKPPPCLKPTMIIQPLPIDGQEQTTFSTIRQGTATNRLTKARARVGENTTIDPVTGNALISHGDMSISIPNFSELEGLKTSTYKLLDAITVAFTESGAKSPTVSLSLDEYMSKCGLKDRKEARRQATMDLEILYNASVSFKENRRHGEPEGFLDVRICEAKGISRTGILSFTFSNTFYGILLGYPIMPYPPLLWRLNAKKNPNSYYFLRRISEHKNMNVGKKNEDVIAVKTLMASSPFMLTYKEVMSGNRNLTARIIDPFERDMNALSETLTWQYCHRNDIPLTQEEQDNFTYEIFAACLIRIHWSSYPDQTRRLEKKAKTLAAVAKSRKKRP